jgi:hypothetical protein
MTKVGKTYFKTALLRVFWLLVWGVSYCRVKFFLCLEECAEKGLVVSCFGKKRCGLGVFVVFVEVVGALSVVGQPNGGIQNARNTLSECGYGPPLWTCRYAGCSD